MLAELVESKWMSHSAIGRAIGLAEYSTVKKEIVDDKEEHAPSKERQVQPLYTMRHISAFVCKVFCIEKISRTKEKGGHMEKEHEVVKPARDPCMGHHNKYDGQRF